MGVAPPTSIDVRARGDAGRTAALARGDDRDCPSQRGVAAATPRPPSQRSRYAVDRLRGYGQISRSQYCFRKASSRPPSSASIKHPPVPLASTMPSTVEAQLCSDRSNEKIRATARSRRCHPGHRPGRPMANRLPGGGLGPPTLPRSASCGLAPGTTAGVKGSSSLEVMEKSRAAIVALSDAEPSSRDESYERR